MTTREFIRLKNFIKTYGNDERNSHSFLKTQKEEFIIKHESKQKDLLGKDTFLGIHYKQIKKLSLWISTNYETVYF